VYRALIVCNYRFRAAQGSLRDLPGPKRYGLLLRCALTNHDTRMFEEANVARPARPASRLARRRGPGVPDRLQRGRALTSRDNHRVQGDRSR
jgi:hypothetical protein